MFLNYYKMQFCLGLDTRLVSRKKKKYIGVKNWHRKTASVEIVLVSAQINYKKITLLYLNEIQTTQIKSI